MKEYKRSSIAMMTVIVACLMPMSVSANSSWHWISSTRPYDLLPIVIVVTLAAETLAITRLAHVQPFSKVLCVVLIGNSLSFAAPYVWSDLTSELYTFSQLLEHWPIYTIGLVYLIVTLLMELPVVYYSLRKSTNNGKRLLWVTVGANVTTTLFTAFVERIFCRGSW